MARKPDTHRVQGKTGEDTTGTATGAHGQPPSGEKDARGLTVDGTGFGEEPAEDPGQAAGAHPRPTTPHPGPKGD